MVDVFELASKGWNSWTISKVIFVGIDHCFADGMSTSSNNSIKIKEVS